MAEKAHNTPGAARIPLPDTSADIPSTAQVSADKFTLRAMLERQFAKFEGGPTMEEILADLDRFRSGGVPRELIAPAIRADREERCR
jgi:hypothetical protein